MNESASWSTLRRHLGNAHIQRFEDKTTAGIPDTNVCFVGGREVWLEGKFLEKYPVRDATLIKVKLKPEQALWLWLRLRAGGNAFVWVRVPDGWYLFETAESFFKLRDGVPREEFVGMGKYFNCAYEMAEYLAAGGSTKKDGL